MMPILNIQTSQVGDIGILPSMATILTNDSESTILTPGYLNNAVQAGATFNLPCIAKISSKADAISDYRVGWYQIVHVGENWSVVAADVGSGGVTLPTTLNHLAIYTDEAGNLGQDANNVINAGNISAGLNGTSGAFNSWPPGLNKGHLSIAAVANIGNTDIIIHNAAHAQTSTYTIPDSGAADANFIVSGVGLIDGNLLMSSGTDGVIVDSGISALTVPQIAQVSLTAAQFNSMYAAPVLLLAAQGANTMIIVDSIQLQMTFVTTAYAAGGVVAAQYGNTANGLGVHASSDEPAADFFAAASTVFKLNGGIEPSPFASCANQGLYLSNLTGAFTTGDSTFRIKTYYHVISTIV